MVNLLHYDLIGEFRRQFYKDLLTINDVVGSQIKLNKLEFPDGATKDDANFWGYILEKDGKKFLLSSVDSEGNELILKDVLPILPNKCLKVASKGFAYSWIQEPISMKFKEDKKMTFKQLVNKLSSMAHSNDKHQKLLWFMTLSQYIDRANFRFCSNPSFGKDSTVDIIGNLIGGCATIENPTIAKLEMMANSTKLLAVNEVVDVSKSDWRNIQQFLLAAGAHKNELTKHSRATASGTSEFIDIRKFSISLMYNDISDYTNMERYFDFVTKDAVKDRFPSFRLHGVFEEDFNNIKNINKKKYVKEHFEEYKDIIYTITYYTKNLLKEIHRYDSSRLNKDIPKRWIINIGRLLRIIDVYCDTQEEFDYWIDIINNSMKDYSEMLKYNKFLNKLSSKLPQEEFHDTVNKISTMATYIEKVGLMREKTSSQRKIVDIKTIWDTEKELI